PLPDALPILGGHADTAPETIDQALALDPDYALAHYYRGQVLYEAKGDPAAAIKAWERFLVLVPSGAEHDQVQALIKDARGRPAPAAAPPPRRPRPHPGPRPPGRSSRDCA